MAERNIPPDERYEGNVSLSPGEIGDAFANDEHVAWYPHADPPAFGRDDAPPFEAWPHGPNAILVRRRIPRRWMTPTPYVLIDLQRRLAGGTHVRARFVARPPHMMFSNNLGAVVVVAILSCVALVLTQPLLALALHQVLLLTAIPVALVFRYLSNRPSRASMLAFGAPLRALIGAKFIPHALGEADSPFRQRALGDHT